MRTFTQKPKATEQTTTAKFTKPGRAYFGHSREVGSILHLQRTIGNQAVQQLLEANPGNGKEDSGTTGADRFSHDFSRIPVHSSAPTGIQPKLIVNTPGDIYEQEADRVAEHVVRTREPDLQSQVDKEEEELLQTKPLVQRRVSSDVDGTEAPPIVHEALRSPGQPLDPATRAFMQSRFGQDFSQVRVHTDQKAAESARAINALAYTVGRNVVFGPDAYAPETISGRRLLSHELTHVIQQSGSAPAPRVQRQGPNGGAAVGTSEVDDGFSDQTTLSAPRYRIRVVGHASPRWHRPGASTPELRNLALSERRARAVEGALRSLFRARERPIEFDLSCELIDSDSNSFETDWRGMEETLEEVGGAREANDPTLRRVDVEVDVIESTIETGGYTEVVTLPTATTRWSIKVDVLEGAVGAAGSMGQGELRNRETGQKVKGRWIAGGGGGGIDLPIPSVAPGSWTDFETTNPVTFSSFDGTPVRLTSIAAGIGIGYGTAEFRFTYLMDKSVTLNGVAFNQWGIGGSVTAGPWNFTQRIPPPPTEAREHEIAYQTTAGVQFGHLVLFPTGRDLIPAAEMSALADFVARLP